MPLKKNISSAVNNNINAQISSDAATNISEEVNSHISLKSLSLKESGEIINVNNVTYSTVHDNIDMYNNFVADDYYASKNWVLSKNYLTKEDIGDIDITNNIEELLNNKADKVHDHNDLYYTKDVIDITDNLLKEELTNKIPTKTSQLVNDSNYTTATQLNKITELIPNTATVDNQLADKNFVNSSISTATAEFRGTVENLEELNSISANINDYAFYKHIDKNGNTLFDRYKFTDKWEYEYTLNNSSFTAEQWATINSGLTENSIPTNYVTTDTEQRVTGRKIFAVRPMCEVEKTTGHYLPDEYQEVEYIQSSGSQYINTGVNPKIKPRVVMKMAMIDPRDSDYFGNSSINGSAFFGDFSAYSLMYYRYGSTSALNTGISVKQNQWHEWDMSQSVYLDGDLRYTTTNTYTYNSNQINICIFKCRNYATYQLAYFILYDGEEKVREFYPCYRKSDSEIGLYDKVTNKFYPNSGRGVFIKGADVQSGTFIEEYELATSEALKTMSYNDLLDKPLIPTHISQLTNDKNYLTKTNGDSYYQAKGNYALKSEIPTVPTKVSELTNDSGFVTIGVIPTKTSELTNDSDYTTSKDIQTAINNIPSAGFEDVLEGVVGRTKVEWNSLNAGEYGSNSTYNGATLPPVMLESTTAFWNSGSGKPLDISFHFTKKEKITSLQVKCPPYGGNSTTMTIYYAQEGDTELTLYKKIATISIVERKSYDFNEEGISADYWVIRFTTSGWIDLRLCKPGSSFTPGLYSEVFHEQLMDKMNGYQPVGNYALKSEIPTVPTKTSQLINDSSYITSTDLNKVTELIPNTATTENKLVDKNFVNSSISTATATFKGTFDNLTELQQTSADLNDYAYFKHIDDNHNIVYSRYKYSDGVWNFEYNLNTTGFTAEQWATINSGLTENSIPTKISELTNDSNFITINDIPREIFICVYSVTSYDEILQAYNKGKLILCRYGSTYGLFSGKSGDYFDFVTLCTTQSTLRLACYKRTPKDVWTLSVVFLENSRNRVNSISETSTDIQYPSAKCVYDAISNFVTAEDVPTDYVDLSSNQTIDGTKIFTVVPKLSRSAYVNANVVLPDEYQLVEYIQSSGIEYIDTKSRVIANTRFTCTWGSVFNNGSFVASSTENKGYGQGNPSGSSPNIAGGGRLQNSVVTFWLSGSNYSTSLSASASTSIYTDIITTSENTLNFSMADIISDTVFINKTLTNFTIYPVHNMFLFRDSSGQYPFYSAKKIYDVKFETRASSSEEFTVVKHLIPCYRKSDHVCGFYDVIGNEFYTNKGTGAFVSGSDIIDGKLLYNLGFNYNTMLSELRSITGYDSSKTQVLKNVNGIFKWVNE